jgi:septum formation protein
LASASPRRRALLADAGIGFEVDVSGVDETVETEWLSAPGSLEPGARVAMELAARKARAVAARRPGMQVLGADTVVVTEEGELLGTPKDRAEAKRMIELLNGRPHRVHTGVVLIEGHMERHRVATAIVRFRALTPDEIDAYVATGEGDDKAGAYGYQGLGRALVASVEGDAETVIGLPIAVVKDLLSTARRESMVSFAAAVAFLLAAILIFAAPAPAVENWTEYRYADPPIGTLTVLTIEVEARLIGGDTMIVRRFDGRRLEIVVQDTTPRRLILDRAEDGLLEYLIEPRFAPRAESVRPARPAIPSPASVLREPPPVIQSSRPVSPPITPSPPPTVLVTPPASSSTRPVAGSSIEPAAAPPVATAVAPVAIAIGRETGGTVAVERPAALGRDQKPETSLEQFGVTKPGEVAHFTLAQELIDRGLHTDAIAQFLDFVARYPKSLMKEAAMMRVGRAYHLRGEEHEREAIRQKDLRRSGAANEEIDKAIQDFNSATDAFRVVQATFPNSHQATSIQLAIAQAMHGRIRAQFQKGGAPMDEPLVVVEYLRVTSADGESRPLSSARLGIAQYYRDLGDARLAARLDRVLILEAYQRAMKEYREIIAAFPNEPASEESLIDMARLLDRNLELRRFQEAVRFYDLLVTRFPASRFAAEARERSKWIKENYL